MSAFPSQNYYSQEIHPPGLTYYLTIGPFFEGGDTNRGSSFGGETSLIGMWCSGDRDSRHNLLGAGLSIGAGKFGYYIEGEFVLQYSSSSKGNRTLGHDYPLFYFTVGVGYFGKYKDEYLVDRGIQWTLSGTPLTAFFPIFLVIRGQYESSSINTTTAGVLAKIPIELYTPK